MSRTLRLGFAAVYYLALIAVALSLGMLVAVNSSIRKHGRPTQGTLLCCFFLSGGTHLCVGYFIPVLVQGVLFTVTLPLAWIPERGIKVYRNTSIGIVVAIWLLVAGNVALSWQRYDDWRKRVPFESLAERVPIPTHGGSASGELWNELEQKYAMDPRGREDSLHAVHDGRVWLFHEAAGFGSLRMRSRPVNPKHFGPDLTPPVPQPGRYDPNAVSLGDEMPDKLRKPFGELHVNGLLDFVNPDGFGYVKSRTEVAGFRPHRFSKVPEPVEMWTVLRLELVGLLLHPKPVVYVSENLPRMADVKRLPTREPDSFEADGVTALRAGDDLYTRGDDRDARMVGAIRSVDQCVKCHGGERGDLLGAFSYRLRRDGK